MHRSVFDGAAAAVNPSMDNYFSTLQYRQLYTVPSFTLDATPESLANIKVNLNDRHTKGDNVSRPAWCWTTQEAFPIIAAPPETLTSSGAFLGFSDICSKKLT